MNFSNTLFRNSLSLTLLFSSSIVMAFSSSAMQQVNTGRSATTYDAAVYVARSEAFLVSINKCKAMGKSLQNSQELLDNIKVIYKQESQGFHLVKVASKYRCGS